MFAARPYAGRDRGIHGAVAVSPSRCGRDHPAGDGGEDQRQPRRSAMLVREGARVRAGQCQRTLPARRGALQPGATCRSARIARAQHRDQQRESRCAVPAWLRVRRTGAARRGARSECARRASQSDTFARAGQPLHRPVQSAALRGAGRQSCAAPHAARRGDRGGAAAGPLQSRLRVPSERVSCRGAARIPAGATARRGRSARAAGDGRGPLGAPGSGRGA